MNKVLVEVLVPAAGEKFDMFIPLNIKMGDVLKMVKTAVSELTDGKYKPDSQTAIFNGDTGEIYDVNIEGAELGIKNGSHLMLI